MTVLVTGATGNVGRELVRQLADAGHAVRALTRNPDAAQLGDGVEVVGGDLTDVASVEAALTGVTALHLITFAGWEPLATAPKIMELAIREGVGRVSVLGGDIEEGPVEEAVAASGLPWTRLIPVEFMSNTLEWAASVRAEGVVREPFPQALSALVHDADIAAVAAADLTSDLPGKQERVITGPEALTIPERVRILGDAIGREVTYVELTRDEVVEQWRAEGYSDDDMAFFLEMRTNPPEAGYTPQPTVEQVTGRAPRTFAQWAAEHADTFRP